MILSGCSHLAGSSPDRHSRLTLKWQRLVAWLGLFAMLMIYMAPLVSQTMMMDRTTHHHQQMAAHHVTHAPTGHQDAHALHHAWCGYCSLLLHMSGLTHMPLQLACHRAVWVGLRVTIQPFLLRSEWCKTQLPRAPPILPFS
ncbi:DUF2946 domain-containing protein [Vibrio rhizosphaerae]|uniref:DUF2946 domain-containing protein n=1 Tax=Vibrio rhizosphaerae TaxID=398736 RepID=A0ABU4IVJ7_9VIBR|nr:DUF2946 domain-containing protein [Vibrio rhizosphaerae]MDW6093385.1 DUF2946 domain-containing protein [Vibrio rhizosphaerae]